jgi:hypothetical protein
MSYELRFKRWLCTVWPEHATRVEPRLGGDNGVADIFLCWEGRLVPVEVKVMDYQVRSESWKWRETRPAQEGWHNLIGAAGINSYFVAGGYRNNRLRHIEFYRWGDALMSCEPKDFVKRLMDKLEKDHD